MKKFLLFLLLAFPAISRSQIESASDAVDFGIIRETEGPKRLRVYIRNVGTEPSALLKVRPTCGCTAADFMEATFLPGDSAWIDLTYDPYRRPGSFEKGVKVYPVNGEMIRIPIKGTVMASPETIGEMFPVDAGLLHLSESTIMTLSPLGSENRTLYIDTYNSGDKPIWLGLESGSEAISTQPFPSPLPPGEKGLIGVYVDPSRESRTGRLEYDLRLIMSAEGPLANEDTDKETFPLKLLTEKH